LTDFENYHGRKKYASNITGAYYAARKEICEYLYNIRRQARVLIFREVRGGYLVPLGVWVIRETVKNAMAMGPIKKLDNFQSSIHDLAGGLMVGFKHWKHSSEMIDYITHQKTIYNFL
jgi:hypothetical protein